MVGAGGDDAHDNRNGSHHRSGNGQHVGGLATLPPGVYDAYRRVVVAIVIH